MAAIFTQIHPEERRGEIEISPVGSQIPLDIILLFSSSTSRRSSLLGNAGGKKTERMTTLILLFSYRDREARHQPDASWLYFMHWILLMIIMWIVMMMPNELHIRREHRRGNTWWEPKSTDTFSISQHEESESATKCSNHYSHCFHCENSRGETSGESTHRGTHGRSTTQSLKPSWSSSSLFSAETKGGTESKKSVNLKRRRGEELMRQNEMRSEKREGGSGDDEMRREDEEEEVWKTQIFVKTSYSVSSSP